VYPLVPLTSSILPAALLLEKKHFLTEKKEIRGQNGREKKILPKKSFSFFSFL